jgi:hypothetical protein
MELSPISEQSRTKCSNSSKAILPPSLVHLSREFERSSILSGLYPFAADQLFAAANPAISAQMAPGRRLPFELCSQENAVRERVSLERRLRPASRGNTRAAVVR